MLKHIIGQAIFQLALLIFLIFYGEHFIPEYVDSYDSSIFAANPSDKWYNGIIGGTVRSGRFYTVQGGDDYVTIYDATFVYSRHYTFIFNTFVMMQVFNFINARKLHEEWNVFEGITKNIYFIIIVFGIFAMQIILVTFSGNAFGVYDNYGLTVQQWLISVALGSISLVINIFLKMLPIGKSEHIHETSGIGNKVGEMKRRSVLSLKRIE